MAYTVPATFASAIACPSTCTSLIDPAGISASVAALSNPILPPTMILFELLCPRFFSFAGKYNPRPEHGKESQTYCHRSRRHSKRSCRHSEQREESLFDRSVSDGSNNERPSVQLGNAHAIPPRAFRLIQHFIRLAHQRVKIFQAAALAAC